MKQTSFEQAKRKWGVVFSTYISLVKSYFQFPDGYPNFALGLDGPRPEVTRAYQ